jgi:hypothetical protein
MHASKMRVVAILGLRRRTPNDRQSMSHEVQGCAVLMPELRKVDVA